MMARLAIRVLVAVWALISIGMGALAFFVLREGYDASLAAASYEAFETIPEGLMIGLGFDGSPVIIDIAYWVALAAAAYFAFRPR